MKIIQKKVYTNLKKLYNIDATCFSIVFRCFCKLRFWWNHRLYNYERTSSQVAEISTKHHCKNDVWFVLTPIWLAVDLLLRQLVSNTISISDYIQLHDRYYQWTSNCYTL